MSFEDVFASLLLQDAIMRFLLILFVLFTVVGLLYLTYRFLYKERGNKNWLNLTTFDKISFSALTGLVCFIPVVLLLLIYASILTFLKPIFPMADIDTAIQNGNSVMGAIIIFLIGAYPFLSNRFIEKSENCFDILSGLLKRDNVLQFIVWTLPAMLILISFFTKDLNHFLLGTLIYVIILLKMLVAHKLKGAERRKIHLTKKAQQGPLYPYWLLLIEFIFKDVIFLPAIMAQNSFGLLIGGIIYLGDILAVILSVYYRHSLELLIQFIVTSIAAESLIKSN